MRSIRCRFHVVGRLLERVREEPLEVTGALLELGARWAVSSVRSYGPAERGQLG